MTAGGHEKTDLNPKYVLYFALALVVAGVVIYGALRWMFYRFEQEQARQDRPVPVNVSPAVPEPRLQINPQGDLEALRRQENEVLSTYGWIDPDQGIARIPIDRAMQLFIERQKK
jgi:hypothetical protein